MKPIHRAAFLGDSITMGYGLADAADRYSTVFCKRIGAEECNYGITGTLMARAGLSKSDGTSFLDRYEAMEDADLAVVFGATNDYFWSDMPIFPDTPDASEDDGYFANAVRRLCRGMREKYPGIPTVFILPYSMHSNRADSSGWKAPFSTNRVHTGLLTRW